MTDPSSEYFADLAASELRLPVYSVTAVFWSPQFNGLWLEGFSGGKAYRVVRFRDDLESSWIEEEWRLPEDAVMLWAAPTRIEGSEDRPRLPS